MTAEEMADEGTAVFVARKDGAAVACGALRRHPDKIGEVKRMYTSPDHQGEGIGGLVLREIEALARQEGCVRLVLETGLPHAAARHLYARNGFVKCGPVLDYPDIASSIFFEKRLGPTSA